jgi:hypothetical protein
LEDLAGADGYLTTLAHALPLLDEHEDLARRDVVRDDTPGLHILSVSPTVMVANLAHRHRDYATEVEVMERYERLEDELRLAPEWRWSSLPAKIERARELRDLPPRRPPGRPRKGA